jgi:hypothetical protein
VATYPLVGGPCDGRRSFNFTVEPLDDFEYFCLGNTYAFVRSDRRFHWVDTSGSPVGEAALGVHAPRAWAHLQRAVNRKLPTALRRAQVVRRATLQMISRRSRRR